MSYTALARKWRPRRFEELTGTKPRWPRRRQTKKGKR